MLKYLLINKFCASLSKSHSKNQFFSKAFKRYFIITMLMLLAIPIQAQRHMENLDRGVVAVRTGSDEVFLSWRMLGTETEDVGYNLYRGSTKVNSEPITDSTNFIDEAGEDHFYSVRAVIDGEEQGASAPVSVWAEQYKSLPIQQPSGGTTPDGISYTYTANDVSVGDVDGDGEYEIILKWNPTNAKDNSQGGYTGNVYLDAYKLDGTRLWRIDLGKNIRAGAHYTQFIVYDLDSDGKAEVACKTADGTIDGVGEVIGDPDADHRNSWGTILAGPEYLTVFNGESGAAMATVDYLPPRHPDTENPTSGQMDEVWGDDYGNRMDRFLAGVGYFDGERPSLLMSRGYYTRTVLATWDWRDGELTQRWIFDSDDEGNSAYAGQGNHQLSIADVDQDGKDEVVFGSMTVDDDGTGLYNSGLGHGDAMHVSDIDPDRPGLEIWTAHESPGQYDGNGLWLRDAKTGEKLWGVPATGDVGRGLAADVDPRHKGYEMWGARGGLYNAKGEQISSSKPKMNFAVWWDGDLLREILDGDILDKWNYETNSHDRLYTLYQTGAEKINGTKANPNLSADIFGDWREELIYRHNNNSELLIFTTTIPTEHRIYTLMHDPQYRVSIAWQNVAYNQPPHPGFYLGEDMDDPPIPDIKLVGDDPLANKGPFPDKWKLDDLFGECEISDITPPTATSLKGEIITGTTQDPLTYIGGGEYTITWEYKDADGNTVQQQQLVLIEDNTPPSVKTSDLTVEKEEGETVVVSPEDIDAGSEDNCGEIELALSRSEFSGEGDYQVELTVRDASGNESVGTAMISIKTKSVKTKATGVHVVPTLLEDTSVAKVIVPEGSSIGRVEVLEAASGKSLSFEGNNQEQMEIDIAPLKGTLLVRVKDQNGDVHLKKLIAL
jgi:rhamnogalacturonan endolyase